MATAKTDAQKVQELRKQAMDKSLPQEVRDQADMKANDIEKKAVEKETGMKLAKGGAVGKMPMKAAAKQPMKKPAAKTMMSKGGAAMKKAKGK